MAVVLHRNRFGSRFPIVFLLLLVLGIATVLIMRSSVTKSEEAKQLLAERTSPSDTPLTQPAASGTSTVAPRAKSLAPSSSSAARPAQSWQASLQPQVVAATRVDSLAEYQLQMDRWSCEGKVCVGDLRIPPNVEAGRQRDLYAPTKILDNLQKAMASSDIDVGIRSVQVDGEGLGLTMQFTPDASTHGRFYTYAEIAAIRSDSMEQASKNCSGQSR